METRAIDTHAHLFLEDFSGDIDAITYRAQQSCHAVLLPNLDLQTLPSLQRLLHAYPGFYFGMIGLHPMHVKENYREELSALEMYLNREPWIAIGEVGLDLYYTRETQAAQEEALFIQAEWAKKLHLPLSIHFREALRETLAVLHPLRGEIRGVFHCFTGTYEEGKAILDSGFYLGIGGVLTYKNATTLQDAVRKIPLSSMVLETDSPYLAPVPLRGKRNESSYILHTARVLASLKGLHLEEVLEHTTQTATELFRLAEFSAPQRHEAK
ncbi:MAG: TatD family hydrolase [Bacteroidia bacterium]|nr:TatD family hydrolase [Bacteroidia bacterium]MDW8235352.1 TatD family hydrolase [Bacteroidia bacterium]